MKTTDLGRRWKLVIAAVLIITAPLIAETETDYLAIILQNQKVGHAIHERKVEDGKVFTTDSFSMTLGRGGQAITVTSSETHIETLDAKPLGFEISMTTSGVEQKTVGTIQDGKAIMSRQVMDQAQEMTVDWPADALLSEGLRQFQLKQGLTPGNTFQVKLFRPDLMMSVLADVRVQDKTEVDLFGRPIELTRVDMTMNVQDQKIEMVSYVDEDNKALKTIVPMMGMTLEMLACDKSFALSDDEIVDFLEKLSIASPVKLLNLNEANSANYLLKSTIDKPLQLPNSDSQNAKKTDQGIQVTVKRPAPAENIAFPYKGDNAEALEALKPGDYLQSDNEKVIELAKHAVGDANDATAAAKQIEAFVDGYITQKNLSVGYASAAEVAQSRQGDCSEHAVLTAAMCRAVGIPARVVCGVVYADTFLSKHSIFGGHMWTEVFLDGTWVGLDATRSELKGFGPGHIALSYGNGDPADFFSLVNTLGCFEITKITLDTKDNEVSEDNNDTAENGDKNDG